MSKTLEQLEAELNADIPEEAVFTKPGKGSASYVKGFYVIDELNAVLGPLGWNWCTRETVLEHCSQDDKGKWTVVYRVMGELRVATSVVDSYVDVSKQGSACGSGQGYSLPDCMHNAIGEAETDALKRAARLYGRHMGLALYDSSQAYVTKAPPPEPTTVKEINAVSFLGDLEALKPRVVIATGKTKEKLVAAYKAKKEELAA